jgi:hypothetical protein
MAFRTISSDRGLTGWREKMMPLATASTISMQAMPMAHWSKDTP